MCDVRGFSASTIMRHGQCQRHIVRGFKVLPDEQVVEKLKNIIGLNSLLSEHVMVPCCDEKSQVRAFDRTQPSLPAEGQDFTFETPA